MEVKSGYIFRIYPTATQKQVLAQEFGNARYLYNHLLADAKENNKFDWLGASKQITKMRSEIDWLGNGSRTTQQNALEQLKDAYTRMFKKQNKYPSFKSKSNHQSVTYSEKTNQVGEKSIRVSKALGHIKAKITRNLDSAPKEIVISKTPDSKYFCSWNVDREIKHLPATNNYIGIDLGLIDYISTSDGEKVSNPKWMKCKEIRLKRYQRKYSRNKLLPKSNRKCKLRIKLAKCYADVTNARADFQHKLSWSLVKQNQVICVEDLNVAGMLQNRKLSKSIQQAGWSQFTQMLKYKCNWYGRSFVQIDRFEPSSKTCSCCGWKADEMNLSIRDWICPKCQTEHNRDVNAAQNILRAGLARINAQGEVWTSASCEEIVVICKPDTMSGLH